MKPKWNLDELCRGVAFLPWDDFCADPAQRAAVVQRGIGADRIVRRFAGLGLPGVEGDDPVNRAPAPPSEGWQAFLEGKGPLPFTASTSDEDSYGDIITGPWRLQRFRSNPVMPLNHNYYSRLPIGTANVKYDKENERLLGEACFDEEDPDDRRIAGKYRRRVMRGFSVGFRPGKVSIRSQLPDDHPFKGARGLWLSDGELLEVSAVGIPANATALASRGEPAEDAEPTQRVALLDELLALLGDPTVRAQLGLPAVPPAPTSPPPPAEDWLSSLPAH